MNKKKEKKFKDEFFFLNAIKHFASGGLNKRRHASISQILFVST
jgi:hypothetical protein